MKMCNQAPRKISYGTCTCHDAEFEKIKSFVIIGTHGGAWDPRGRVSLSFRESKEIKNRSDSRLKINYSALDTAQVHRVLYVRWTHRYSCVIIYMSRRDTYSTRTRDYNINVHFKIPIFALNLSSAKRFESYTYNNKRSEKLSRAPCADSQVELAANVLGYFSIIQLACVLQRLEMQSRQLYCDRGESFFSYYIHVHNTRNARRGSGFNCKRLRRVTEANYFGFSPKSASALMKKKWCQRLESTHFFCGAVHMRIPTIIPHATMSCTRAEPRQQLALYSRALHDSFSRCCCCCRFWKKFVDRVIFTRSSLRNKITRRAAAAATTTTTTSTTTEKKGKTPRKSSCAQIQSRGSERELILNCNGSSSSLCSSLCVNSRIYPKELLLLLLPLLT
ncbi:unnamed protein product, partial [Trichogramma brassicae]